MLYQFIVENFKTYKDETILNLAAASYDEHLNHVCNGFKKGTKLLRTSAIYGPNASGKTNLIKAMSFAQSLITEGTIGEMAIDTHPFRLSEKSKRSPSRFEFIFESHERVYHYGIIVDKDIVHEEWLSDLTDSSEKLVFQREFKNGRSSVKSGKKVFNKKSDRELIDFIARTTRVNQPFLKEAFEKNLDQIKNVFRWFSDSLQIIPAIADYRALEIRTKSDELFSNFLGRLLKEVGTGIEKIETQVLELDFDKYLPHVDNSNRETIQSLIKKENSAVTLDDGKGNKYFIHLNENRKPELLRLRAIHINEDGEEVPFELREESEGTRRYLNLIPLLYDTLNEDRVYVVDELDRRLHPDLVLSFLKMFLNQKKEGKSQLIFTSHNTLLMDQELLRRDELWFIEKDLKKGCSKLYSLTDLKVRNDLKLDKAYLHGRFGAVPKINKSLFYK